MFAHGLEDVLGRQAADGLFQVAVVLHCAAGFQGLGQRGDELRVVAAGDLDAEVAALASSLAGKPGFSLRTTKEQVNAVTEDMASTRRNASDADILTAAMADEESRAISRDYLARRRPGA